MRATYCPNCASPLDDGDERCPSCGIVLAEWLRPELLDEPDDQALQGTASLRRLEVDELAADAGAPADEGGAVDGIAEAVGEPTADELPEEGDVPAEDDAPAAGDVPAGGEVPDKDDAPAEGEVPDKDDAPAEGEVPEEDEAVLPLDEVLTKEAPLSVRYARREEDEPDGWSSDHNLPLGILVGMVVVLLLVLLAMSRCGNRFVDPYAPRMGQQASGQAASPSGDSEAGSPTQEGGSDADGSQAASSGGSQATASGNPVADGEDERRLRQTLVERQFELKSLAQKVDASERAFDDGYADRWVERNAHAADANALLEQVKSAYQDLSSQQVEADSSLRGQYLLLLRCHADLVDRMQIVSELWERDLWYDYPQYEQKTILEPRTSKTDADGRLAPKADYDEALSQISL